jgi:cytochrome c biogenesis protein CcmG/thiol:disulfide interchange protein DsbE
LQLKFAIPVALFALLVLVFYQGLYRNPSYVPSPLIGKQAPVFELPDLSRPENVVGSADMAGKVSLLNVWATWCVGCRQEHDTLLRIASASDVPIYGLNWKDDPESARSWLDQLGDPYVASAMDLDGRVAIDWGVYGAPETFLIDADGTVLYKHLSPMTLAIWQSEFVPRITAAQAE